MKRTGSHSVLLVDSSPAGSPSHTLLPRLVLQLTSGPFRPTLAAFGRPAYISGLHRLGLRVHVFPAHQKPHLPLAVAATLWLGLLARREKARIVHSFGTLAHAYCAPAARLAGDAGELWQIEDPPPCCGSTEATQLSTIEKAALAVPYNRVVALSPSLRVPFRGALTCPIPSLLEKGQWEALAGIDDERLDSELALRVRAVYTEML